MGGSDKFTLGEDLGGASAGTSSTLGAAYNIFCTIVGVGLLQVSYGCAMMGWAGIAVLLVMGVMSWYTAVILIRCFGLAKEVLLDSRTATTSSPTKCNSYKEPHTYGDIGEFTYGRVGRLLAEVQVHVGLVLVACIYNLLAGINLAQLAPPELDWLTPQVGAAIVACVAWLHVFLKTLGEVAAVSAVNMMITLSLATVVVVEAFRHPPPVEPRHTVFVPEFMKLGMGVASFCGAYGVHPVLPSIYKSMKRPEQYEGMISATFGLVVLVTLPVMLVGYGVYGSDVRSPIYETQPLASSPLVKVMVGLITGHIVGAYAIVLNPPELAVERLLSVEQRRCPQLWRVCSRTLFVFFTLAVSVIMGSHFPPLMGLAMAVSVTFTLYIFPCIFYHKLRRMVGRPVGLAELVWIGMVLLVAVFGAVFGTVGAIRDMVEDW